MTPTETATGQTAKDALPQFDGFPYLNTRLVPSLYHITLLPADAPEGALRNLARRQADANRLDTCLVLGAERAVFFWADGRIQPSQITPRGGTLLANRLTLPVDLLDTDEIRLRQARLNRLVESDCRKGTYIFGNLAKGGRTATEMELVGLNGLEADGMPRGLQQCRRCNDWCGECLDSNKEFRGMVMTVHCLCANHNRCARCGAQLYARRLNANFYDPRDGGIWHVPGFCGLSHRCASSLNGR